MTNSCVKWTLGAAVALAILPGPALAKDCPPEVLSLDDREDAIRKAPSCKEALAIMVACAFGASGDTGLGEAVRERCEPEFLPKLSKGDRKAYDQSIKRCDRKYRNESGTMYRSFEAFCRAQLEVRTADKFGKPKR